MVARPFDSVDPGIRGRHRIARPSPRTAARYPLRLRTVVIAPDMLDAVRFAGGWLFDRVMAGGEALVLTEDHGDLRPLRILGARAINLECALSSPVQGPWPPQAIAAGTDAFRSNARVRRIVLKAVDDGLADVRLWGDPRSASLGAGPIRYRLSAAARAFKTHALAAAAVPTGGSVTAIETFATVSEGDDA